MHVVNLVQKQQDTVFSVNRKILQEKIVQWLLIYRSSLVEMLLGRYVFWKYAANLQENT